MQFNLYSSIQVFINLGVYCSGDIWSCIFVEVVATGTANMTMPIYKEVSVQAVDSENAQCKGVVLGRVLAAQIGV